VTPDSAHCDRFAGVEAIDRGRRWVAYAAALWATVFAVFHVIWAAGWYPLLNAEQARLAFATPWKWAYCVVVATTGQFTTLGIWEPWFYLGAILFTLSTWRSRPGR